MITLLETADDEDLRLITANRDSLKL